jgi:hypothetical protein
MPPSAAAVFSGSAVIARLLKSQRSDGKPRVRDRMTEMFQHRNITQNHRIYGGENVAGVPDDLQFGDGAPGPGSSRCALRPG